MTAAHPGDALRDEAFRRLDLSDCNDENTLLREVILDLAARKVTVSSNDLPDWVRESTKASRRGRVFRLLADEGWLRPVGEIKSSNRRAHGKAVKVYVWAGKKAA